VPVDSDPEFLLSLFDDILNRMNGLDAASHFLAGLNVECDEVYARGQSSIYAQ